MTKTQIRYHHLSKLKDKIEKVLVDLQEASIEADNMLNDAITDGDQSPEMIESLESIADARKEAYRFIKRVHKRAEKLTGEAWLRTP